METRSKGKQLDTTLSVSADEGAHEHSSPLDDAEVRAHLLKLRATYEKREGAYHAGATPRNRRNPRQRHKVRKDITTLRLSRHVLAAFRATGKGWQARIDAALCDLVNNGQISPQAPGEAPPLPVARSGNDACPLFQRHSLCPSA